MLKIEIKKWLAVKAIGFALWILPKGEFKKRFAKFIFVNIEIL